jgi:hypothetical protein
MKSLVTTTTTTALIFALGITIAVHAQTAPRVRAHPASNVRREMPAAEKSFVEGIRHESDRKFVG